MTALTRMSDIPAVDPSRWRERCSETPTDHRSHAAAIGVSAGDLITPDGDRVWKVAGFQEDRILCWTLEEAQYGRVPGKFVRDDVRNYAPLRTINASPHVDAFISAYLNNWNDVGCDINLHTLAVNDELLRPFGQDCWWRVIDSEPYFLLTDLVAEHDCTLNGIPGKRGTLLQPDTREIRASWTKKPVDDQSLYRLFNDNGDLLYVGISSNELRRWKEHAKTKSWWREVHTFTIERFPSRSSVEKAEREAIVSEHPRYNVIHNSKAAR